MTSRIALVTGGTGGIGTAICQRLADQGPPPNFDTSVPLWGEPRKEAVNGQ